MKPRPSAIATVTLGGLCVGEPATLSPGDFLAYEHLVFPSVRREYRAGIAGGSILALGMDSAGEAAGIVVVDIDDSVDGWIIRYLFTLERCRRRGVARAMLDAVLLRARKVGANRVVAHCPDSGASSGPLKIALEKAGFARTGAARVLFHFDLDACLIPAIRKLDDSYGRFLYHRESRRFASFADLGPREYERLSGLPGEFCAPGFHPLRRRTSLDDCSRDSTPSIIAFEDDTPVGWIVFNNPRDTILFVDSLFVVDDRRNRGLFLELLRRSLGEMGSRYAKLVFYVDRDNRGMLGLMRIFETFVRKKESLLRYSVEP